MNFQILFEHDDGLSIINIPLTNIGTKAVTEAEQLFGCTIPLSAVNDVVQAVSAETVVIDVGSQEAEALEIFRETAVIVVNVPYQALNPFVKQVPVIVMHADKGVIDLTFRNEVDLNWLLNAWIDDNCQAFWTPDKYKIKETQGT